MSEKNEYKLSEVERMLLLELQAQANQAAQEAINRAAVEALAPFNAQSQGIVSLIYRQQGLAGKWTLSADKTSLTRQEA